jgi:hypothetical protein
MAIVKKNTYVPGSNNDLTNVALNIDLQRLGTDLTHVVYSGGNFLIKVGSLVECNGSLYAVEGADISIAPASGVLIFDSSTLLFSISASAFAYDATKSGEYITGSPTKRVCKWVLGASGSVNIRDYNNANPWTTGIGVEKSGTDTQNNWFDFFAPYIPNTNDTLLCAGGWGSFVIASNMKRTSSTVITVTAWNGTAVTTQTFTDGSATNFTGALAI